MNETEMRTTALELAVKAGDVNPAVAVARAKAYLEFLRNADAPTLSDMLEPKRGV